MMGRFYYLIVACLFNISPSVLTAQASVSDSLEQVFRDENASISERIDAGFAYTKKLKKKKDLTKAYLELIDLSNQKNDFAKEALAHWQLGKTYYDHKVYDSAQIYYMSALSFYSDQDDLQSLASLKRNIGSVEFKTGNYTKALDIFQECLSIEEQNGNQQGIAACYNLIGGVHRNLKQYDGALEYYKKCVEISERDSIKKTLIDASGNLGIVYRLIDSIALSIKYFEKTLLLSKENGLKGRVAVCLNNMGILYEKLGNIELADKYLNEAITTYESMGRKPSSQIQSALGRVKILKGEYQSANQNCQMALEMALASGNEKDIRSAYPCLIRSAQKNDDAARALKFMQEYDVLKDSLFKASNVKQLTELELKYEFEKEQQLVEMEKNEMEINFKNKRNLMLLGMVSLGFISLLGFRLSRIRKKNNKVLEEKNNIITNALEEKEVLIKEIHHRVKNNLQLVSSLLTLQSREIEDESALQAINAGKARVRSMALIHQDLYSNDNLKGISAEKYLRNLCEELFHTYNVSEDQVKLELEIEDVNLDIDSVVPMGLIINELITNSLKHAFEKDKEGKLSIKLFEEGSILKLTISDNGKGLDPEHFKQTKSFGNKLIYTLLEQLGGEMKISNKEGTQFNLSFSDYQLAS
jgi:two-component sensor histidine kinase/tetratricopeptide (TPR) repeat protein